MVFSTYVEVILPSASRTALALSILHVCGGDPVGAVAVVSNSKVFSTYVEVILDDMGLIQHQVGILHVCGGDPK